MNRIYIDGIKTRQNIAEETKQALGVKALCEELGVSVGLVNKYIRRGYGDGQTIIEMIRKGIPFELSKEPVPCRARKAHTRGRKDEIDWNESEAEARTEYEEACKREYLEKVNAEWNHRLNALKASCQSIIEQIEAIQQAEVFESLFGGKNNE